MQGCFFFPSRGRHTRWPRDWSSDVCSSDLEIPQERQPLADAVVRALRRKRADVQFVDDRLIERDACPVGVRPRIMIGVNDLGRPVHTVGLKTRGGLGKVVAADSDPIVSAGTDVLADSLEEAAR